MRKKLQNVVHIMNRDIFVGERYERNMRSMAFKDIILACLCFVMFAVNLFQRNGMGNGIGRTSALASVLAIGMSAAASWYLNRVRRNRAAAMTISVATLTLVLSYDVLWQRNGFAYLWTLLVPLTVSYFVGLKVGFFTTAYFLVLFIFAYWTPYRQNIIDWYPPIVVERFPILYFFTGWFSLFIMYEYQKSVLLEIDYADRLHAEVERQTAVAVRRGDKLERLSYQMVETLARAIDAKDKYTRGHSFRVMQYSVELARKLGWDETEIEELRREALLHDIGKIGIPDAVLNKPGKLTEAEYETIQSHTEIGMNILSGIEDMTGAASVAGCHHERYDGLGYPSGLRGEEIPEHARVVAIADAYDAMHSDRIYRLTMPREAMLRELREGRGIQFDPVYLDAFLSLMDAGALNSVA